MIRLAYFLMMLSSANMKSDLLTVRQFCRWGTGLYRAMVRARCALACFMEADSTAAAASCPSPPRSMSPSPESTVLGADSSPNRAILQRDEETARLRVFYYRTTSTKEKNQNEPNVKKKKGSTCNPLTAFRAPQKLQIPITPYSREQKGLYYSSGFYFRIRKKIIRSFNDIQVHELQNLRLSHQRVSLRSYQLLMRARLSTRAAERGGKRATEFKPCSFLSTSKLLLIRQTGGSVIKNYSALIRWRDPREVFANFTHLLDPVNLTGGGSRVKGSPFNASDSLENCKWTCPLIRSENVQPEEPHDQTYLTNLITCWKMITQPGAHEHREPPPTVKFHDGDFRNSSE